MRTISTRTRQARQSARITQSGLAETLGVSRSAVAQWEGAVGSVPATENLARLSVALHCAFEWLATGRGSRYVSAKARAEAEDSPEVAVMLTQFARDDEEEHMLATFRGLHPHDQGIAISVLEQLASRPGAASPRSRAPSRTRA